MERKSKDGCDSCGLSVSRRTFLAGTGAAALALRMDALEKASGLFSSAPKPPGKARVQVVYVRPEKEPDVSWPGGNCDIPAQQALFTRTLREAEAKLDVQLDVRDEPIKTREEAGAFLQQITQSPPDGLLVGSMSNVTWDIADDIVQKRGPVPTIVYSDMTGFTSHLQIGRNTPKTLVGATQEVEWLRTAVRMFHTLGRTKNTRILVLVDKPGPDATLQPWGTTLHFAHKERFAEAYRQVETSDEVRAIAETYRKGAAKIVEPTGQEIVDAAKNYIVCRRLMAAENCHGISIACIPWTAAPVCMSLSKLLDEGIVAGCEADQNGVLEHLLSILLLNRPGFQQDPSPNTVNNTLMGAHCMSAIRLEGLDHPYRAPYWLRSYHTRTGSVMQVMWPIGKEVTVLYIDAKTPTMFVGTGRVRANIAQPPAGCCRTAVELDMDRVGDTRDVKGFHQLFILGNHELTLKAYGRLAGIEVQPIA
jgi:hypothetical protein